MRAVTLAFLIRRDSEGRASEINLGMKKRGFGKGHWNGTGGKLEPGETVEQALVREGREELSVEITRAQPVGALKFFFPHKPELNLDVSIFLVEQWQGRLSAAR